MFRFNKKNLLNLEYLNTPPLLSIDSKGEKNSLRIKKIKSFFLLIDSFAQMCLLSIPLSRIIGTFILEDINGKL